MALSFPLGRFVGFSWIDWTLLAIVVISALISLKRGFMAEALSLLVWLVAGVMAWLFGGTLAGHMKAYIEQPSLRVLAASSLIFVVSLLLGGGVNLLVGRLVDVTGLAGTDRFLGMVFGAARGALAAVVLVGLLSYTPLKEDPWWKQSRLVPEFVMVADWAKNQALKVSRNWLDAVENPAPSSSVRLPSAAAANG